MALKKVPSTGIEQKEEEDSTNDGIHSTTLEDNQIQSILHLLETNKKCTVQCTMYISVQ